MKSLMILFILFTYSIAAQDFIVERISGNVKVLKGTSDVWESVSNGQVLSGSDLIYTEKSSTVQLRKEDEVFVLNGDVAIGINKLKKYSIHELILALTLDEIRNVPKIKSNSNSKNTAVYGTNTAENNDIELEMNILGNKKLNGAKYLSKNGFIESSIIVAREVFRNYPHTAQIFDERMYFADLLDNLGLYQEALTEYSKITKIDLTVEQKQLVVKRSEEITLKLFQEK